MSLTVSSDQVNNERVNEREALTKTARTQSFDSDDWGSQASEDPYAFETDEESTVSEPVYQNEVPLADKAGRVPTIFLPNGQSAKQIQATPEDVKNAVLKQQDKIADKVAGEIVEQQVKKAMKANQSGATFAQVRQAEKKIEQIQKIEDEKNYSEIARLCRLMTAKKKIYKDRFPNFRWRQQYIAERLTLAQVREDNKEIDLLLNSQHVPNILAKWIVQTMGIVGELANSTPYGTMLEGLRNDTEVLIKSGELDSEILQLSVELGEYLTLGPKARLAAKLSSMVMTNYENTQKKKNSGPHTSSIDPEATSDL